MLARRFAMAVGAGRSTQSLDLKESCASGTSCPIPRLRHSAHLALGVSHAWWGRGVATDLMKEAFRWAPTVGLSRFELSVMTTNTRAIALYERLGFKFEGLRRRAYMIKGVAVDDHVMGYVFEV